MPLVPRWKWIVLVALASLVGLGNANAAFEQFAIAPDGKTIAYVYCERDSTPSKVCVAIGDLESGKKKVAIPVPEGPIFLTYAPDGKTLAATVARCAFVQAPGMDRIEVHANETRWTRCRTTSLQGWRWR